MNIDNIFLSRDSSRAIKGFLIFLIVLGHNAVFTNSLKGSFNYIYLFHVQAFFILPFLYKINKRDDFKTLFKKNFIRLYYPFINFFILLSILNFLLQYVAMMNLDSDVLYNDVNQHNF